MIRMPLIHNMIYVSSRVVHHATWVLGEGLAPHNLQQESPVVRTFIHPAGARKCDTGRHRVKRLLFPSDWMVWASKTSGREEFWACTNGRVASKELAIDTDHFMADKLAD